MLRLKTLDIMKHVTPSSTIAMTPSTAQMERLHALLTDILTDIDAFCRQNGIRYFLGGGTALGALRHGGFIPWDDDMDICMPRKDFDRFIRSFRDAHGEKYWVHSPNDADTHGITMGRVRRKGTCVRDRNDLHEQECGAFVDIFIYENTFDNPLLRFAHGVGSLALGLLSSLRKFRQDRQRLLVLVKGNAIAENAVRTKAALGLIVSWGSLDFWIHMTNRWHRLCGNEHSRYVTCPGGRKHFFGQLAPREEFSELRDISFNGVQVLVCRGLESHLRRLYGPDYMTVPPEEKRERHIFLKPFSV